MKKKYLTLMSLVLAMGGSIAQANNYQSMSAVSVFACLQDKDEMDDDFDNCEEVDAFTEKQALAWLKENAAWALGRIKKDLKESPDDKKEILMEVSEIAFEFEEIKELSPKLAKDFLELERLGLELEENLVKMEGEAPAAIKAALKPDVVKLLTAQMNFEKNMLAIEIEEAKAEMKELEQAITEVDELSDDLLEELLSGEDE